MALSHSQVFQRALPIILASASTPLLGLADTAMLGFFGSTQDLAALAVVNILFNFIFWSFGFLRMSTSGLVAQNSGYQEPVQLQWIVLRSFVVAITIGCVLLTLQLPLKHLAFYFFHANAEVEAVAKSYFDIRIWGAPATLLYYCVCGALIGTGRSLPLLILQVSLNSLSILLNFLFVYVFNLGVAGLALGTIISEYFILTVALSIFYSHFPSVAGNKNVAEVARHVFNQDALKKLISINRDLFVRTLFLLASFFWFTNQSARLGDTVLAANQILLALISFSAFFLDGFAYVAEAEVGKQIGLGNRVAMKRVVRVTSEAAAATAIVIGMLLLSSSAHVLAMFTDINTVKTQALNTVHFAALYIMLSFPAFQLDGIFIGATASAAMRNASCISFILFIASYYLLTYIEPVKGLWLSFITYVLFRAASLAFHYPQILRKCQSNAPEELA